MWHVFFEGGSKFQERKRRPEVCQLGWQLLHQLLGLVQLRGWVQFPSQICQSNNQWEHLESRIQMETWPWSVFNSFCSPSASSTWCCQKMKNSFESCYSPSEIWLASVETSLGTGSEQESGENAFQMTTMSNVHQIPLPSPLSGRNSLVLWTLWDLSPIMTLVICGIMLEVFTFIKTMNHR